MNRSTIKPFSPSFTVSVGHKENSWGTHLTWKKRKEDSAPQRLQKRGGLHGLRNLMVGGELFMVVWLHTINLSTWGSLAFAKTEARCEQGSNLYPSSPFIT